MRLKRWRPNWDREGDSPTEERIHPGKAILIEEQPGIADLAYALERGGNAHLYMRGNCEDGRENEIPVLKEVHVRVRHNGCWEEVESFEEEHGVEAQKAWETGKNNAIRVEYKTCSPDGIERWEAIESNIAVSALEAMDEPMVLMTEGGKPTVETLAKIMWDHTHEEAEEQGRHKSVHEVRCISEAARHCETQIRSVELVVEAATKRFVDGWVPSDLEVNVTINSNGVKATAKRTERPKPHQFKSSHETIGAERSGATTLNPSDSRNEGETQTIE